MLNQRERGVAMVAALVTAMVVAGLGALLLARTVGEARHSRDNAAVVQTLLLARGGANLGGVLLNGPAEAALDIIVNNRSSTTARWSFGTGTSTSQRPTVASVAAALTGNSAAETGSDSVAEDFQNTLDALQCNQTATLTGVSAQVTVRIYVDLNEPGDNACGTLPPPGVRLPPGRFITGKPRTAVGQPANQTYAIPYAMVAEASQNGYRRNVVIQGEYRFEVGRSSFAKYALFTNVHQSQGGDNIWFTDSTLFDGPVHTNQHFRFSRSPWFNSSVTSAGCNTPGATDCTAASSGGSTYTPGGRFDCITGCASGESEKFLSPAQMAPSAYAPQYKGTAPQLPDPSDPTLRVDWNAKFVKLPTESEELFNQATKPLADVGVPGGLALPCPHPPGTPTSVASCDTDDAVDLYSLDLAAVDANFNKLTKDSQGNWTPKATYQTITACTSSSSSSCTVYYYGPTTGNKLWQYNLAAGPTPASNRKQAPRKGEFNGVIYVNGQITRLRGPDRVPSNSIYPADAPPALAAFAQLTVASSRERDGSSSTTGRIRITGDLKYEDPPCTGAPTRSGTTVIRADCTKNPNAENVLGIYSQDGDVSIGHDYSSSSDASAPYDVEIHGVLMSSRGVVKVDNHDDGSERGSVRLLGGIIEYNYGAFGTFNTGTGKMTTGYARRFTYDTRMREGIAPPYFPTTGTDEVHSMSVYAFGQREQVY